MNFKKATAGLSLLIGLAILGHACQPETVQDKRSSVSSTTGQTTQQPATGNKGDNATAGDTQTGNTTTTPTTPGTNTGTPAAGAAAGSYTMAWDASADAAIVSYKVFLVTPDRNVRLPGKTDVPIQIKSYPVAGLTKNGTKYSVTVTAAEVKAALGALTTTSYCFTVVAVNAVGNSSHSPVICP